jgi:probable rRNA maturation factor
VAWVSSAVIHKINLTYRHKDKPTNILSFPLGPNEGEILLCRELMEDQEAVPLFIHGLVHLKGYDHGSRMEQEEKKVIDFFNSHATNYHRRP